MAVLEDEEGDIENVLEEEADKIREKEKKEKQELIAQLQDYKIKVSFIFFWIYFFRVSFCKFIKLYFQISNVRN